MSGHTSRIAELGVICMHDHNANENTAAWNVNIPDNIHNKKRSLLMLRCYANHRSFLYIPILIPLLPLLLYLYFLKQYIGISVASVVSVAAGPYLQAGCAHRQQSCLTQSDRGLRRLLNTQCLLYAFG